MVITFSYQDNAHSKNTNGNTDNKGKLLSLR
jgi:hypothetical protein